MFELIKDIEEKLNIEFENSKIQYFTDGATDSTVFSINDKYLIKTVDKKAFKAQIEFFNKYKNKYFQILKYANEELGYLCFEYIDGKKLEKLIKIDVNNIIKQIYDITSLYRKYDYDGYGYLFEDVNKSWYQFLCDEVEYSKKEIQDIDDTKVLKALENIKSYNVDKYLIHGDFGTHNFLFSNNLKVIDPMCVVGDYLYDFYFAIFSNSLLFTKINIDDILSFFDRKLEYKKSLLIIVFYIRMSRAHKYDMKNYKKYLEYYNKL